MNAEAYQAKVYHKTYRLFLSKFIVNCNYKCLVRVSKMCCWGYEDVYLEEPPPKKKEPKVEYVMMDSNPPKPVEPPVEAPVCHVFSHRRPPHPNLHPSSHPLFATLRLPTQAVTPQL